MNPSKFPILRRNFLPQTTQKPQLHLLTAYSWLCRKSPRRNFLYLKEISWTKKAFPKHYFTKIHFSTLETPVAEAMMQRVGGTNLAASEPGCSFVQFVFQGSLREKFSNTLQLPSLTDILSEKRQSLWLCATFSQPFGYVNTEVCMNSLVL